MEHRHDRRVACELNVELYRAGISLGKAKTVDISNEGIHLETDIHLKRNEMISIVFLDDISIPGWPVRERGIVAHVAQGHAGLWFGRIVRHDLA